MVREVIEVDAGFSQTNKKTETMVFDALNSETRDRFTQDVSTGYSIGWNRKGQSVPSSCVKNGSDISLYKVIPLKQQGLTGCFSESVGKTVAKIECCWMVPFPETTPGTSSRVKMLYRYWHELDSGYVEE